MRAETDGPGFSRDDWTSEPLGQLVFHPSGVSSPAVAIFRDADGGELLLTLDSFSNGPRLSRPDVVY